MVANHVRFVKNNGYTAPHADEKATAEFCLQIARKVCGTHGNADGRKPDQTEMCGLDFLTSCFELLAGLKNLYKDHDPRTCYYVHAHKHWTLGDVKYAQWVKKQGCLILEGPESIFRKQTLGQQKPC